MGKEQHFLTFTLHATSRVSKPKAPHIDWQYNNTQDWLATDRGEKEEHFQKILVKVTG